MEQPSDAGGRPAWVRRVTVTLVLLSLAGLVLPAWFYEWRGRTHLIPVAAAVFFLSSLSLLIELVSSARLRREVLDARRIEAVEVASLSRPAGEATWDVARVKLETYLNRNLDQVRAIFWLSAGVMVVGFLIIAGGVATALWMPETHVTTALVSAGSGVLVEFIGATLMVIYKSTMVQAQSYMRVLERINAVGMAVQILAGLEHGHEAREAAMIRVAEQLLQMYAAEAPPPA